MTSHFHFTSRASLSFFTMAMGSLSLWGFSFGPVHGVTPAPGDRPGVACTACHRGTALNGGGGSLKVSFANGLTYTPGQTQTLTINITDFAANVFGFEMTARLESGTSTQQAGSFTAGQNQRVICADDKPAPTGGCPNNGIEWIEHAQPFPTGTITVQWTAPAAGAGNVHLFVAANAANADGSFTGDHIYGTDYVLVPAGSSGTVPTISSTGVVNGASYAQTIQSGSCVTIFGSNFATATATWEGAAIDGVLPTTLAGVTVSIDGRPAPVSFVSPNQVNVIAPSDSTIGPVNVAVANANGWSQTAIAQLAGFSPAFFTFSQNQGRYLAAQIAIPGTPVTYQYLAPDGTLGTSLSSRPAKVGEIIVLYGTGFGPTSTPVNPELVFSGAAPVAHRASLPSTAPISVTIGGQAAQVQFAGISASGLYQLNVVVPQLTAGDQPVVATTFDGISTTQQVYISVQ